MSKRGAGGGGTVEDVIARSLAAAETLKEQTRLANEATKDLKRALGEHRELVRQTVHDEIDETLKAHADRALAGMADEVMQALAMAESRVLRRVESLYERWIEGERGEPTLAELMASRQALRKGIEAAERDRATAHGGGERSGDVTVGGRASEPGEIVDG